MNDDALTRRRFLAGGAALAAFAACRQSGEHPPPSTVGPPVGGAGRRPYGERSTFERDVRTFNPQTSTPGTGSSRTPLQASQGIITPSSLHFERHHAGVPALDPARHELLLHGLVRRPLVLRVADLKRLPSVSRIHFIECAATAGASTPVARARIHSRAMVW
jgi:sulfane dehydrogenase subunit SoxC